MWTCKLCGAQSEEAPFCFGAEAPWRELVAEGDFEKRVELTKDQCVVHDKAFFIRGHVEIPILGLDEPFRWSVWCSLSEPSHQRVCERWDDSSRKGDSYFGWLSTDIPTYPNTINLESTVLSRELGRVPLVIIQECDNPLFADQEKGISLDRTHEIAHQLLH